MYSHGSSAHVGVGKRGHGGRNYRPPPDRNKNNGELVPPPLKACSCLVQLDLSEYMQLAGFVSSASSLTEVSSEVADPSSRRRLHTCFPGDTLEQRRKSVQQCEKHLRSRFGVHLVIPGRTQQAPVAIVGQSYRETIPATAWLLQQLMLPRNSGDSASVGGRIQKNVKDPNDGTLEGRWWQQQKLDDIQESNGVNLDPYWLFQSISWSVMACDLLTRRRASEPASDDQSSPSSPKSILELLQTCIDNLKFRVGWTELQGMDVFFHTLRTKEMNVLLSSMAFAAGHPEKVAVLFEEVQQVGR